MIPSFPSTIDKLVKISLPGIQKVGKIATFGALSLALGAAFGCDGPSECPGVSGFELDHIIQLDPLHDHTPIWSTDTGHVLFRDNIVDSNGTNLGSIVKDSRRGGRCDLNYSPDVSPDGSRVAYTTFRHTTGFLFFGGTNNFEIVASALDGSSYRRLTKNDVIDIHPVWSPDGSQIAFLSSLNSNWAHGFHMYVMKADGSDVRSVAPSNPAYAVRPTWSPDGTRVAFLGQAGRIFTVSPDGSNPRRLGEATGPPVWSPDGEHLAFARLSGGRLVDLVIVSESADSSEERTIFTAPANSFAEVSGLNRNEYLFDIAWSSDGSEIRFVATRLGPVHTNATHRL